MIISYQPLAVLVAPPGLPGFLGSPMKSEEVLGRLIFLMEILIDRDKSYEFMVMPMNA